MAVQADFRYNMNHPLIQTNSTDLLRGYIVCKKSELIKAITTTALYWG